MSTRAQSGKDSESADATVWKGMTDSEGSSEAEVKDEAEARSSGEEGSKAEARDGRLDGPRAAFTSTLREQRCHALGVARATTQVGRHAGNDAAGADWHDQRGIARRGAQVIETNGVVPDAGVKAATVPPSAKDEPPAPPVAVPWVSMPPPPPPRPPPPPLPA